MLKIQQFYFRLVAWGRFYWNAVTKYQVHSPFVFQWITDVLEDQRHYYAFGAIDALRAKMLASNTPVQVLDYGAGPNAVLENQQQPTQRNTTLKKIVQRASSDHRQGEMLFKMADLYAPKYILELGTSVGLGTLYIAQGGRSSAQFVSLEGCPNSAEIACLNLRTLGVKNVAIRAGSFEQNLKKAVQDMPQLDFVYFDGNHQAAPTLSYFQVCLDKVHKDSIFIWDDVHWSQGMENAWETIKKHEKVTLTIDCGHFACAFFNPDHKIKQHFQIVPSSWKPWKVF
jgi:predicted O-methyltransferase YrrM